MGVCKILLILLRGLQTLMIFYRYRRVRPYWRYTNAVHTRIACHCIAHSFMGIVHYYYYVIIVTFRRQKKRHKSRAAAIATAIQRKQFTHRVIINTVNRIWTGVCKLQRNPMQTRYDYL